ncbi:MAG: GIY-YIG nuclease family protein [Flammeovirgaceae bacterium]|nr:GIY-YIG nuclease family protein [Flammeovirgaceae bacterium]
MFFVYILKSKNTGRFYIGFSESPTRRLAEHNSGKVKSTKSFRPWIKVYSEKFETKIQAVRRERELKAKKSRTFIQQLIGSHSPD